MHIRFPQIETARLKLRAPVPEDVRPLESLWSDPDVTKYIPIILFRTREELEEFIPLTRQRWTERGFGMLIVTTKENDTVIGYCGLQFLNSSPQVEIYYGFSKNAWDQGFATEAARSMLRFAFETAKLESVAGVTQPENTASQKVLEKIGLKKDPEMKTFYDNVCVYFTISREDFSPDDSPYKLTYEEQGEE
ncbi:MAG TPA: GNAT family N-acetyltransferase [Pyrinomonadaceae bacterium]|jgi:ribosomal-protein-alanine N-acetyltransferase|nr:GNAT family N-acetyltransferase [Pyrinomonadaceae bacterium]